MNKIVETISGNKVPRNKCRRIKRNFYEIGKDCFLMPDGKYHRLNNGYIYYDYETKKAHYNADKYYGVIEGIVDYVNSGFVRGKFTANSLKNISILNQDSFKLETAISEEVAAKANYKKNPLSEVYSLNGTSNIRINDAENLEYTCDNYLSTATKLFYKNKGINSKEVNLIYKKFFNTLSLIDNNYLFGFEFETSSGALSKHKLNQLGLIPLKDGSLRENGRPLAFEYVTVPYNKVDLFKFLPEVCSELQNNCTFSNKCSLHLHISGLENSKQNVVALWILINLIQKELFDLFPEYKKDPSILKREKNYCKPYSKEYLPNDLYYNNLFELNIQNKIDTYFKAIYYYLSGGYNLNDEFNRSNLRHPRGSKWNIQSRYHLINLVSFLFSKSKTVEFRLHTPTFNFDKIINWTYICYAILKYVERHSFSIIKDSNTSINLNQIIKDTYNKNPKIYQSLISYIDFRKQTQTKTGDEELNTDSRMLIDEFKIY